MRAIKIQSEPQPPAVGTWYWYDIPQIHHLPSIPRAGIMLMIPDASQEYGRVWLKMAGKDDLHHQTPKRYTITGDDDAITVAEEIHHRPGVGAIRGEWKGTLKSGELATLPV